jgi:hypothetical protein
MRTIRVKMKSIVVAVGCLIRGYLNLSVDKIVLSCILIRMSRVVRQGFLNVGFIGELLFCINF